MTGSLLRPDIALEIGNFMALYWEDVEKNDGRRTAEHFADDGVFDAKMVCFTGRQQIREWFKWREGIGRTARHLLTNLYFDFEGYAERGEVNSRGIMTHFGGDGRGVLLAGPPIGIYDYRMLLRRGGEFGWLILRLETYPVFVAPDHVALKYPNSKNQQESRPNGDRATG